MTPVQEHDLYMRDRAAWAAYVAPHWAHILKNADAGERARAWALACPELKRAIRELERLTAETGPTAALFGSAPTTRLAA